MQGLRSGAGLAHGEGGALARGMSDGSWRRVNDCAWRLTSSGYHIGGKP
jgi:hypothetical protein